MKHADSPPKALLASVLTAGVCAISAAAILIRMAEAPGITTAFLRATISAALMALIARIQLGAGWWRLERREALTCAWAGVFLGLHFWAWMTSLEYTTVASSVLFVTMNPIFVGLLSPLVTGDRISGRLWVGIALAVAGSLIVGFDDLRVGPSRSLLGNGLALVGALCGSAYLLAGRRARRTVHLSAYATLTNASAALLLLPLALLLGAPLDALPAHSWLMFLLLAVFPQLVGHNSLVWALRHLSPAMVAIAILAEPIGSGLLAWAIFDEAITPTKLLGAAVLLSGIFTASVGPTSPQAPDAPQP